MRTAKYSEPQMIPLKLSPIKHPLTGYYNIKHSSNLDDNRSSHLQTTPDKTFHITSHDQYHTKTSKNTNTIELIFLYYKSNQINQSKHPNKLNNRPTRLQNPPQNQNPDKTPPRPNQN